MALDVGAAFAEERRVVAWREQSQTLTLVTPWIFDSFRSCTELL